MKSTIEEIRKRFDRDVERFSNLETGQSATIDAPLVLDLIADVASGTNPNATRVLDVGCGAGNYSLKLLDKLPGLNIDLVDLSMPMLERAQQRVGEATDGSVRIFQEDIRQMELETNSYDIQMAAASLHHLRSTKEWEAVFEKLFRALKPGGSLWISDLVMHSSNAVQTVMWNRYGHYLSGLKGDDYRDHVFDYIEKEDSPRPLMYQIDLLRDVGFESIDILHKNSVFAAFGGIKPV